MNARTSNEEYPTVRIAAVHAAPVFLDREATLDKVEDLTADAVRHGAELVAFGEAFVSGYPIWNGVMPPVDTHDLHEQLVRSSVEVPSPAAERLSRIADRLDVVLSVGVNEVAGHSSGQVFNSNLVFGTDGQLLNHRRKLVATWYERLTWSHGDGYELRPVNLDGWNLGTLICGENTNPLAKYALVAQGERLHVATYPPTWPFDPRETSTEYDLTEAIKIRTGAHCFEGKVFAAVPATALGTDALDMVAGDDEAMRKSLLNAQSASMVMGPRGEILAGPVSGDDQVIYGDAQLSDAITLKRAHDVAGTYNRFDVFSLNVNATRHVPITVSGTTPRSTSVADLEQDQQSTDDSDRK